MGLWPQEKSKGSQGEEKASSLFLESFRCLTVSFLPIGQETDPSLACHLVLSELVAKYDFISKFSPPTPTGD